MAFRHGAADALLNAATYPVLPLHQINWFMSALQNDRAVLD